MTPLDAERAAPGAPSYADQNSRTQRDREYGRSCCTPQKARLEETIMFDGNPEERAIEDQSNGNRAPYDLTHYMG